MNAITQTQNDDKTFVLEIEQDLLGACIVDPLCFVDARAFVKDYHFCLPVHKAIFRAFHECYERFKTISVPIIENNFNEEDNKELASITNMNFREYLVRLSVNTLTMRTGIIERAKAVVTQWARLQIIAKAEQIYLAAKSPFVEAGTLVSNFNQEADAILADCRYGRNRETRSSLKGAINDVFQNLEETKCQKNSLTGITWGLIDLNRLTGGVQKRDLTLIGARPSMGKTTFATSVARAAAKKGHGVGIISLEMDRSKLASRMISDLAFDHNITVPYVEIIRGEVSQNDKDNLISICDAYAKLPILIDDQAGLTITDVRMKLESMIRTSEASGVSLDLFIIDHLGLLKATNRYSGNRTNEIAEMTAALKSMAREYDVAILLLSQLNRQLEQRTDKRPQLSDLRDSGAIEQDADTIIFLHREAYYLEREKQTDFAKESARIERLADKQNTLEIQIAKQRNGPITAIDAFVNIACAAVRNGAK